MKNSKTLIPAWLVAKHAQAVRAVASLPTYAGVTIYRNPDCDHTAAHAGMVSHAFVDTLDAHDAPDAPACGHACDDDATDATCDDAPLMGIATAND
jgi:hypothetical protein